MSDEAVKSSPSGWVQAWPDALAFVAGLALAWFNNWQTKDLVWSLWLSSLLVGYGMIVWDIFGTSTPGLSGAVKQAGAFPIAGATVVLAGRIFLLGFFTVHFGMFHFIHAAFLNGFFPVLPGRHGFMNPQVFGRVFHDYWPFVLVAALAERKCFRRDAGSSANGGLMQPYKNVVRLHLLIFFFAFTSFAHLQNFAVYAVVYAVYFFPWRLVFPAKLKPVGA